MKRVYLRGAPRHHRPDHEEGGRGEVEFVGEQSHQDKEEPSQEESHHAQEQD